MKHKWLSQVGAQACAVAMAATLMLSVTASPASAADADPIRIGVLTDLSGKYADLSGAGTVTAIKMAVADFGGKVLDRPIEVMVADHQNKPDVAAAVAREWIDQKHVQVLMDFMDSAAGLAVVKVAAQKNTISIVNGAASTRFTNEDCTPFSVHYTWDTYATANGTGYAVARSGGKSWYIIAADYAFGKSLTEDVSNVVKANGGTVVGVARHPLGTTDFSSYIVQAQQSGADVMAFATAGRDVQNAIKAASEFGLTRSGKQKIAALAIFTTDIRSIGLQATQGLYATEAFYWDQNAQTRAWSQRYFKLTGNMPTAMQAGNYSSTMHYLQAVQAAKTDNATAVMAKMREMPINDFFATNGHIRADGRMVHDMLLVQVKKPSESTGSWDIYNVRQVIPGDQAFQPLSASRCALLQAAK